MIYKCKNCGGPVVFDASVGQLKCEHCNSLFRIDEYEGQTFEETKQSVQATPSFEDNTMEISVYSCSSCGAELLLNSTESSTFCSFCGQPTVVFNRVSREQRPDKIIPFKITKEQAIGILKEKLGGNKYVPEEIKNANIQSVHGIYMPYWIFDIHAHSKHKVIKANGKHSSHYYKDVDANFHMTYDASRELNDIMSARIQPFDLSEAVPFDASYLSGFYADKFDVPADQIQYAAVKNVYDAMGRMACSEVAKHFGGSPYSETLSENSNVNKVEYALFPAYFVTMRYNGQSYSVIVNGQSGKLAACLPVDKKSLLQHKIKYSVTASIVFSILFVAMLFLIPHINNTYAIFLIPLLELAFVFFGGMSSKKKFARDIEIARSKSMNAYSSR